MCWFVANRIYIQNVGLYNGRKLKLTRLIQQSHCPVCTNAKGGELPERTNERTTMKENKNNNISSSSQQPTQQVQALLEIGSRKKAVRDGNMQ